MVQHNNKSTRLNAADKTQTTLRYAVNLQRIAAQVGFDWPNTDGVVEKIKEELKEVLAETSPPYKHDRLQDEVGDLLFACTNLARHLGIDPELALISGNEKFYRRFASLEERLKQEGKNIEEVPLEELNQLWERVKQTK